MARSEIIKIDYLGSVISCNHYKFKGGIHTRPEARAWMNLLGWSIRHLRIKDWALPLNITCSGYFKNGRSAPDLSNLAKCTCDAIAEATGIDDKNFRWHDGKRVIGVEPPYLLITIKEAGNGKAS